jgi:hydroxymethylpyrimidine/phosphomethylpyrimidine kinase
MADAAPAARGRVLAIGGSDSGGGAGVQADIKTVTALGGHAFSAIVAVTVQNSLGVHSVHAVPPDVVEAQIRAVLDDLGADAIKTGMLGGSAVVEAVAGAALERPSIPLVVDPVLISTSGARLLAEDALDALRSGLIPRASLVTPNAPEAEVLAEVEVTDIDGQRRAAEVLLNAGAGAVLVKGGHVAGEKVVDLLATRAGETLFERERIETRHTHGTGCTLASACAAGLAQGLGMDEAVGRAIAYVAEAIRRAPGFGAGAGPLDHGWPLRSP